MRKEIKILGLDMDGTVLTNDKKITVNVRRAIEQAIEKGVAVLPATGRPLSGIPEEFMKIPGIRYVLIANGARVYDTKTQQTLYKQCMDKEQTRIFMRALDKYDMQFNLYIDGKAYITQRDMDVVEQYVKPELIPYFKASRIIVDDMYEVMEQCGEEVEKVNVVFKDPKIRQEAWKMLEEIGNVELTSSTDNNIELNHPEANKGEGLVQLGKIWGIEREQIMACGDSSNDYRMIERVGLGVVMENGAEELKKIADYITKSNEEDGVAYAIEKFIL